MSEKKGLNAKKQLIALILVAVVGFVLLLIYQRQILEDTWQTLIDADIRYVLLLPLIQIVNYFFIGTYYRKMFALFDARISILRSWGVVAAMNFVNQVLPSGGLSGITYLAYGFRATLETGKTTLVQIGRYMGAFGGYLILAPVAFILVYSTGRSEELNMLIDDADSSWGVFVVLIVFVALMGTAIASFFNAKVAHVTGRISLRFINWFNRAVLRRDNHIELEPLKKLNREFHSGTALVKQLGWRRATYPSFFMLLSVTMEVLIVYVSLLAVGGGEVGIGPVFLAFVAANIVGVVSVIPGDVGVHEAAVILVLVGFGVDEPVAISTTLLYRVFNKFIFLPIGFYFYAKILKPAVEASSKKS
jgi:uncharacterized protein (TIRG00374 family)